MSEKDTSTSSTLSPDVYPVFKQRHFRRRGSFRRRRLIRRAMVQYVVRTIATRGALPPAESHDAIRPRPNSLSLMPASDKRLSAATARNRESAGRRKFYKRLMTAVICGANSDPSVAASDTSTSPISSSPLVHFGFSFSSIIFSVRD